MNILFIAPEMHNINAVPEIRAITQTHKTHLLNGVVTLQDIYQAARYQEFDAVHIVGHMGSTSDRLDEIVLSNNEVLDLASMSRVAKLANARLVVFSSCLAARFATYLTKHGVPCCIYTTVQIDDATAWELPNSFYEHCKRTERQGKPLDFRAIFNAVDSGDGTYGILMSEGYYTDILQPIHEALDALTKRVDDLYRILEEHGYSLPNITGTPNRLITILLIVIAATVIIASTITIGESLWHLMG